MKKVQKKRKKEWRVNKLKICENKIMNESCISERTRKERIKKEQKNEGKSKECVKEGNKLMMKEKNEKWTHHKRATYIKKEWKN